MDDLVQRLNVIPNLAPAMTRLERDAAFIDVTILMRVSNLRQRFFGWSGSRYAEYVLARLYEQRCGIDRGPCPALAAGANMPTSAFWVEK